MWAVPVLPDTQLYREARCSFLLSKQPVYKIIHIYYYFIILFLPLRLAMKLNCSGCKPIHVSDSLIPTAKITITPPPHPLLPAPRACISWWVSSFPISQPLWYLYTEKRIMQNAVRRLAEEERGEEEEGGGGYRWIIVSQTSSRN